VEGNSVVVKTKSVVITVVSIVGTSWLIEWVISVLIVGEIVVTT
jgi:hypothetical protein